VGVGVGEGVWADAREGVKKLALRNKRKRVVDIDNARAHISKREKQRVRGERIIDIAVCIERAPAVAPLADLQTIAGADDRERGGAAMTAPAASNAEHAT